MIDYFRMYREHREHDTDKILAISQNIIYDFFLIEINLPAAERTILIQDIDIIKSILDTIELILTPKALHSKYIIIVDRKAALYR